jgi:hypothetical protein
MSIIRNYETPKYVNPTTIDMEIAVSEFLDYRVNMIVPNISWGMGFHECDLLVLTPSDCVWEVEIKISRADLIKDAKKGHGHNSKQIKYLYFAIPEHLSHCHEFIPERAGIIHVVNKVYQGKWYGFKAVKIRQPKVNSDYKMTKQARCEMGRLAAMRIWSLKAARQHVQRLLYKKGALQ